MTSSSVKNYFVVLAYLMTFIILASVFAQVRAELPGLLSGERGDERGAHEQAKDSEGERGDSSLEISTNGEPETQRKGGGSSKPKLETREIRDGDGRVMIEAEFYEDEKIEIIREEALIEDGEVWKKRVRVSSEEHFERPLRVYADIREGHFTSIELYWTNEDGDENIIGKSAHAFRFHDTDGNGYHDRVSWVVPHLSTQEFELVMNFSGSETEGLNNILIEVNEAPGSVSEGQEIKFDFDISYYNKSIVQCGFNISNSSGAVYSNEGFSLSDSELTVNKNLSSGDYAWTTSCYDTTNSNVSNSTSGAFNVVLNLNPVASFNYEVLSGLTVLFDGSQSYDPDGSIVNYSWNFAGGTGSGSVAAYTFNNYGTYAVTLTVTDNDGAQNMTSQSITISQPTNSSSNTTNDSPFFDLDLKSPSNKEIIEEDYVEFEYEAESDKTITSCNLEVDKMINGSSSFSEIKLFDYYNKTISAKSASVNHTMEGFDNGEYYWEVKCFNSGGNSTVASRTFQIKKETITVSSSSKKSNYPSEIAEIDEMLDDVNEFLENSKKHDSIENEIVKELGIVGQINLYKKKLLQMKGDLENNFGLADSQKKQTRLNEVRKEIEEIKKSAIVGINVEESEEFVNNQADDGIKEVIEEYFDAKKTKLSKSTLNSLIKTNLGMQSSVKVLTKIRHVEIEYLDGSKKVTFVKKEIEMPEETEKVVEVLAEKLEVYEFINENSENNRFIEVSADDLNNGVIVYTLDGFVDSREIKEIKTIAITEKISSRGSGQISAFAVFEDFTDGKGITFYFGWVVSLGLIAGLFIYGRRDGTIKKMKKKTEGAAIIKLIKESKAALEYKDTATAKKNYDSIKELYNYIDAKEKAAIYKHISKLKTEIDKSDVSSLLQEYLQAVTQGRKEDALLLYSELKKLYPRIPEKYRSKVNEKIMPTLGMLR